MRRQADPTLIKKYLPITDRRDEYPLPPYAGKSIICESDDDMVETDDEKTGLELDSDDSSGWISETNVGIDSDGEDVLTLAHLDDYDAVRVQANSLEMVDIAVLSYNARPESWENEEVEQLPGILEGKLTNSTKHRMLIDNCKNAQANSLRHVFNKLTFDPEYDTELSSSDESDQIADD